MVLNLFSDSISIFNDDQFEDVSNSRKAFCWKYFLCDKANGKAKCKVEISKGEYCDTIFIAKYGTSMLNRHLKHSHGINELSSSYLGQY